MKIVKVSSKRQITLSKNDLESLGIDIYSKLTKRISNGIIFLEPLKTSIVQQTAGSLAQHIPSTKRHLPFKEVMKQTKIKTAEKLAKTS